MTRAPGSGSDLRVTKLWTDKEVMLRAKSTFKLRDAETGPDVA